MVRARARFAPMLSPQTTMFSPAFRRAIAAARSISAPLKTMPDGPGARLASWIFGGPAAGLGFGFFFFLAAMPFHCTQPFRQSPDPWAGFREADEPARLTVSVL